MTNNKVKEFLEKVANDEGLQRDVQKLQNLEKLVELAGEEFPFTVEEWKEGVKEVKQERDENSEFVSNTGGLLRVPSRVLALDYFPKNLV